jgi:hypothetical protein
MNPETAKRELVHPPGDITNLALPDTPLPCAVSTADFQTPRTSGIVSLKLEHDTGALPCTQDDASSLFTLRLSIVAIVPFTATDTAGLNEEETAHPIAGNRVAFDDIK